MGKKFMGYDNASELLTAIGAKIKAKYTKPTAGIPKSDLATAVQTSLGKADSAVQPATMSEALAAKQNSLSETQLAAVNSGISSTKVGQIETNKTNILYNLNMGVKNILPDLSGTYTVATTTYTWNYNGEIHFKSTDSYTHATDIGTFTLKAGTYVLNNRVVYSAGGAVQGDIRFAVNGESVTPDITSIFTLSQDSIVTVKAYTYGIVDTTITPLLCTKAAWDQSHDYQPPALPNSDLTRLEAEDRAALAEVVDSGAKNEIDISDVTTTGSSFVLDHVAISLSAGSHVFSYTSNQSISGDIELILRNGTTVLADHTVTSTSGRIEIPFTLASAADNITLYSVRAGTYSDFMICTLADWKVSQKFVPHRPDYDTLIKQSTYTTSTTNMSISNLLYDAAKAVGISNPAADTKSFVVSIFTEKSNECLFLYGVYKHGAIGYVVSIANKGITFDGVINNLGTIGWTGGTSPYHVQVRFF